MPSEENADWELSLTAAPMVESMPSLLMEFAEFGKALDTVRTRMHHTNHARTNIPWTKRVLRRDQVERAKVRAKAKVEPRAKAKAKARTKVRAKEKEKEKDRASAARATLPLLNLKRKSGPRQNGRHGTPGLTLPVDIPPTDQPFSQSKMESGVKITPKPENAKVAT